MDETRALRQKTLAAPVRCSGVALHSGAWVKMGLHPAGPDHGIRFRRSDVHVEVAASWRNLVPSELCTTIGQDQVSIATIEHLMAAFAGLEVDNVLVTVDGPEVPVMDGSAAPFVELIERAGLVEQNAPRRAIEILKRVQVAHGGAIASLEPADEFSLNFAIEFASSAIQRQRIVLVPDPETFKRDICGARTFGFLDEVERMRAAGLARGGSLDNAVVISGDRVLNEGGLRFGDEFVRHKALDAMGDLYLAGGPIIGQFRGRRSGHHLNRLLLERLFSDPTAWCHATLPAAQDASVWREPARATA